MRESETHSNKGSFNSFLDCSWVNTDSVFGPLSAIDIVFIRLHGYCSAGLGLEETPVEILQMVCYR